MAWETVAKVDEEEEVESSGWDVVSTIDEPDGPEVVEEEGEAYAGPLHALKGYGKMLSGIGDLPNMASYATWPQRKILDATGIVDAETSDAIVPPRFSESEFMTGSREGLDGQSITEYLDTTPGVEEGSGWDKAQTGVEWGGMGPISAFRKGVSALPDALMAGGAVIGETIGDYFDGGEYGEIAGGLTGLLASLRSGKGVDDAVKTIRDSIWGDPDEVTEKIRKGVEEGEEGTLADLAADQGLADLETGQRGSASRQQYEEAELRRQQQVADEIREPFGTGDPDVARQMGQERINTMLNETIPGYGATRREQVTIPLTEEASEARRGLEEARKAELEAEKRAQEARIPLRTDDTLAEASQKGRQTYDEAATEARNTDVQPLWDDFDALPALDKSEYSTLVKEFRKNLPDSQKDGFNKHADQLRRFTSKKYTEMTPREIKDALAEIRGKINRAYENGKGANTDIQNLQELYSILRDKVADEIPEYAAAMEADAAWRKTYKDGVLGEASEVEPELFFRTMGEQDELGAVMARRLSEANIPGMDEALANRLAALARRRASGVDDAFRAEYESVMQYIPAEFRQQVDEIISADEALEAAAKQGEAQQKLTEATIARTDDALETGLEGVAKRETALKGAVENTVLNQYNNDRVGTINRLLDNPDNVEDLVSLQRSMERLGPEAVESFRANMGDVILERLSTKGPQAGLRAAKGEAPVLNADAIIEFETIAKSLLEAGNDPQTIQQIRQNILKLASKQQKAAARQAMVEREHIMTNIVESAASALGLRMAPGSSLVWSGNIRKAVRGLMGKGTRDAAMMRAIDDFMLNPEKYLDAVLAAESPAKGQQILLSELVAASQAYAQD